MDHSRPTDNPYSAPQGKEEECLATGGDLVRRGRMQLLVVAELCMAFALLSFLAGVVAGDRQLALLAGFVRLPLTGGLMFALGRSGATWARYLTIAFLLLSICADFATFQMADRLENIPSMLMTSAMTVCYIVSAALLLFSRSIREFLHYQADVYG